MATPNTETLGALSGQLATLLNVGARADGKLHLSDLPSGEVNMWAKKKFVRSADTFNKADTWKAADGWCGLSIENALISETTDVSGIEDYYTEDGNNGWKYLKPRGMAYGEMIRLRDMDGYNHNVEPFVSGYTMPDTWAKTDGNFNVTFRIAIDAESGADYLTYKDLPLESYYLGVALVAADGTIYRCTNSTTIDSSGFNVTVNAASLEDGDYVVYPFMSNRVMTFLDGGFYPAKVYALPNCSPSLLTIFDGSVAIRIEGRFNDVVDANGNYSMNVSVVITNNTSLPKLFAINYLYLRHADKKFNDALEADEIQKTMSNASVKANSTFTITGLISNISPALRNDALIWVSLANGTYIKSAKPLQNIIPDTE